MFCGILVWLCAVDFLSWCNGSCYSDLVLGCVFCCLCFSCFRLFLILGDFDFVAVCFGAFDALWLNFLMGFVGYLITSLRWILLWLLFWWW